MEAVEPESNPVCVLVRGPRLTEPCPAWDVQTEKAAEAARSAESGRYICADFPPSSSTSRFNVGAACSATLAPTVQEPVKETRSTRGSVSTVRTTRSTSTAPRFCRWTSAARMFGQIITSSASFHAEPISACRNSPSTPSRWKCGPWTTNTATSRSARTRNAHAAPSSASPRSSSATRTSPNARHAETSAKRNARTAASNVNTRSTNADSSATRTGYRAESRETRARKSVSIRKVPSPSDSSSSTVRLLGR